MATKQRIEVFTAGCPLCVETLSAVKKAVAKCGCEVIERRCEGPKLCAESKQYGITKMPTVVVDGQIIFEGRVTPGQAAILTQ
jgi:hypothetical protein